MPNLINAESNQRIDLKDFLEVINGADAFTRHANQFLTDQSGTGFNSRTFILSGFKADNPTGKQVRVTRGLAILGARVGGAVRYGCMASEGDTEKILDCSSYADGSYFVYVRFEFSLGDVQSRIFWNKDASPAQEFARLLATRRVAGWSMRVESSSPGPEWTKVAEVDVAGGGLTIYDRREFFFEGKAGDNFYPYWGSGTDRDPDRATYGITNLQSFVEMVRAKFKEIVGGGKPWYTDSKFGLLDSLRTADISPTPGFVTSGFGLTVNPGGGNPLAVQIAGGVAYPGRVRTVMASPSTRVLGATKDTYADLKPDGTILYTEVAVGAGLALSSENLRLWMVRTDGSGVVLTSDRRKAGLGLTQLVLGGGGSSPELTFRDLSGSPSYLLSTQRAGGVTFQAWDLGSQAHLDAAYVAAVASSNHSAGSCPTHLAFATTVAAAIAERMRITAEGNLWLGNTAALGVAARALIAKDPTADTRGLAVAAASGASSSMEVSAQTDIGMVAYNAFAANAGAFKFANTLTSTGAVGILFNDTTTYKNRIRFFAENGASTAGSAFTPGPIMSLWKEASAPDAGLAHLVIGDTTNHNTVSATNVIIEAVRSSAAANEGAWLSACLRHMGGNYGEVGVRIKSGNEGASPYYWDIYQGSSAVSGVSAPLRFRQRGGEDLVTFDSTAMTFGGVTNPVNATLHGRLYRKYTGVAHGMTTLATTDTYLHDDLVSASGGARLVGLSGTNTAFKIVGYAANEDTNSSDAAEAAVRVDAAKKSGTTKAAIGTTGNLFAVSNDGSNRFLVKGDGHLYAKFATVGTYDAYEDALACRDAMYAFASEPERVIAYSREKLQAMGIMTPDSLVNIQGVTGLMLGGIGELYMVVKYLLQKLDLDYDAIRREVRGLTV